jgi:membrane-bound ClpP family serine protease
MGGALLLTLCDGWTLRQEEEKTPAENPNAQAAQPIEGQDQIQRRKGYLVQVRLPITATVQEQVESTIRRIIEQTGVVREAAERPVVVLEFDTSNGQNGRGSRLGSCLDLSRFLISNDVSSVELLAYVPGPKGHVDVLDPGAQAPKSELTGHAVLVALACNHLVMHRDSFIGQAGIDEQAIDDGLRNTYQQIAAQRLVLPVEVALCMLDPNQSLYRVDLGEGRSVFVAKGELLRLEAEGKAVQSETINEPGSLPIFASDTLSQFQLLRHRVEARRDIAERFRLSPDALEGDPSLGVPWRAVQLALNGAIDERQASWVIGALGQIDPKVNLIIVTVDSEVGNAAQSLRIANRIADFPSDTTRTVAYVPRSARGNPVLIAMACDHIVMAPDAVLGGGVRKDVQSNTAAMKEPIQELAAKVERDWSLLAALVDPANSVQLWSHKTTAQLRIMSREQHAELDDEDRDNWLPLRDLSAADGISGREAESMFVARYLVDDPSQLKALYQLQGEPLTLTPTWTERLVQGLARFVTRPWVTAWLLFGAMFFLMTEMSTPGIGLPGLLGTICLLLFFWGQSFNGNVHWLEVLLFVAGMAFVLLELFVLPGTGILGLGGVGMIFVAIVLAMQTFIIPRTREDFSRLPISLSMVFAAVAGVFVALILFRKYLSQMPIFKRLMLDTPQSDESLRDIDERESLVNWNHLLGQHGQTVTPLVPAGKAKFGTEVVDVISDGTLVETHCPVVVTEVSGNRVVVQRASD